MSFPVSIEASRLQPFLADVPSHIFPPTFAQVCEEVDAFVGDCLRFAQQALALSGFQGSAEDLCGRRGFPSAVQPVVRWLLEALVLYGLAEEDNRGFRVAGASSPVDLDGSLQQRRRRCPAAEPALAVQKLAFASLPAVLAGEKTGEEALFSLEHLDLWFAYFANSNVHYAPTNALAALALAEAVPADARVAEVGGGGGSAAAAALAALEAAGKRPSFYLFTELHSAFLRRGVRFLRPLVPAGCQLAWQTYDMNLPPQQQGLEPHAFHAVLAVNVLHLAHRPEATLRSLGQLLAPEGVLVLGELIRPAPQAPVHLELPFLLLESYRRTVGADSLRPRPGFLSLAGWQAVLERAGFRLLRVVPRNLASCLEIYPGFYCAALAARPV